MASALGAMSLVLVWDVMSLHDVSSSSLDVVSLA